MSYFDYLEYSINSFTQAEIKNLLKQKEFHIVSCDKFDPLLPDFLLKVAPPSLIIIVAQKVRPNS